MVCGQCLLVPYKMVTFYGAVQFKTFNPKLCVYGKFEDWSLTNDKVPHVLGYFFHKQCLSHRAIWGPAEIMTSNCHTAQTQPIVRSLRFLQSCQHVSQRVPFLFYSSLLFQLCQKSLCECTQSLKELHCLLLVLCFYFACMESFSCDSCQDCRSAEIEKKDVDRAKKVTQG